MIHHCSNCNKPADEKPLVVTQDGTEVARLCLECQSTVLIAKLVLKRDVDGGSFVYDGYIPVACARPVGATG